MNKLELNLIETIINKFGYYEYDFYPDRKFDGVEYCILFRRESWGNIDYIHKFIECDKKNIQLICFASYNFLPICSFISHKCILQKNSFGDFFNHRTMTFYDLDYKNFLKNYKLNYKEVFDLTDRDRRTSCKFPHNLWSVYDLYEHFKNKRVFIDKHIYQKFLNNKNIFNEKDVVALYHISDSSEVLQRLQSDGVKFHWKNHEYNKNIIKISGLDGICTFQMLSSIFLGVGYFGIGGSSSFLSLCLPINSLFLCDSLANMSYAMFVFKGFFNKNLYGIMPNSFFNVFDRSAEKMGLTRREHNISIGWKYQCIKESILNNSSVTLPVVNINEKI